MSLEDTEAGLAIGPVVGQQAGLLGFLLSSRGISGDLRLCLDRMGPWGSQREEEPWPFSWRRPKFLGEDSP